MHGFALGVAIFMRLFSWGKSFVKAVGGCVQYAQNLACFDCINQSDIITLVVKI